MKIKQMVDAVMLQFAAGGDSAAIQEFDKTVHQLIVEIPSKLKTVKKPEAIKAVVRDVLNRYEAFRTTLQKQLRDQGSKVVLNDKEHLAAVLAKICDLDLMAQMAFFGKEVYRPVAEKKGQSTASPGQASFNEEEYKNRLFHVR